MKEPFVLIVTGSREWTNNTLLRAELARIDEENDANVLLKHGAARGADFEAHMYASILGWKIKQFPANWDRYGKSAGFRRNEGMVKSGADLVLAFLKNNSKGTIHCINVAYRYDLEVRIIREEDHG